MILADQRGRFLFEIRPDLFPEGLLSMVEMELWSIYQLYKNDRTAVT